MQAQGQLAEPDPAPVSKMDPPGLRCILICFTGSSVMGLTACHTHNARVVHQEIKSLSSLSRLLLVLLGSTNILQVKT